MILHDRKLILNNGKSCYMRSGEAEDSRKLALYFRQAVQEDEPQELLVGEVPDVYQTRRILQQFAEEERRILLLAWMHRQIVGFGVLYPASPYAHKRHRGQIAVSVLSGHRRIGIGTMLVQQLMHCAAKWEYEQIELELRRDNAAAAALYRQRGFSTRLVREQGYKLPQGYTDALVMERRLDYIR